MIKKLIGLLQEYEKGNLTTEEEIVTLLRLLDTVSEEIYNK